MAIVFAKPPGKRPQKATAASSSSPRVVDARHPKVALAAKRHARLAEAMKQPPDPEVQAFMARMNDSADGPLR